MATITSNATGGNWGTGGTWVGGAIPAANDAVVIATTGTDKVTLNGVYPAAGAFAAITVNSGAILEIPVDVSSGLNQTGDVIFTVSGTLRTAGSSGTTAVALQAGITCTFTQTPTTDGAAGYAFAGTSTILISGAVKDHFKSLAADCGEWAASGDVATVGNVTSITVDAEPTGWLENDLLVIAPTGRTYSHWDTCLINETPVSGTAIAVDGWQGTAPLYAGAGTKSAWNHQGEGTPTQARAEVLNLTRSFKIYSTDTTKRCYISCTTSTTVVMNYVEIYNFGANVSGAQGVTLGGGVNFSSVGCSLRNSARYGFYFNYTTLTGTQTITDTIVWTIALHAYYVLAWSSTGSLTITNSIAGYITNTSNYGFYILDIGSTFPSCRAVGNVSSGFFISEANVSVPDGAYDGIVSHSNGSNGFYWGNTQYTVAANDINAPVVWRNTASGIVVDLWSVLRLTSPVVFGNTTLQLYAANGILVATSPTDSESVATYQSASLRVANGILEIVGGTIRGTPVFVGPGVIRVNGATWNSFGTPTIATGQAGDYSHILSFRHNNTADDHRMYYRYGSVLSNATTRHTASGLSWQHNPTGGAAVWFRPNIYFRVPVQSGIATTIKAWVYEDATYNGTAHPRIVALGGHLQGVTNDTVGDSHSGAEAWEQLTVTVTPTETGMLPFVIEGQGTTGSFYVDDLSVTF